MTEDLRDLGYQIVAISPDRPAKLREMLEQVPDGGWQVLSDPDLAVARALGVAFRVDEPTRVRYRSYGIDLQDASGRDHLLLPVPSVFIVDAKRKIRFVYVDPDHRSRIDPALLVAAAKASR